MRPIYKPWLFVLAMILSFFTIQTALLMMSLEGWTTRPPYWDQASHALDAIHFALALHRASFSQFLAQLNESAMWPPVVPLLQAPFLAVVGENFANVRTWIALCSTPAILMVFVTGVQSHRRFGLLVGGLAASLLSVAPGYLEFCMQEMLEIPGIMLSMLTVFFYLRRLDTGKQKYWYWTSLTGSLLFFTKFNYAILIMLPILVAEFFEQRSFRAQLGLALVSLLRDIRWRSPFMAFVLLYGLLLLYIAQVGIRFELMGHHVLMERAFGNPIYLLVLFILIRNLIVNRPLLVRYGKAIWQADEPVRSLFRFNILPALLWLSYPSFFSTFFIFLFNEKTRKSSFFSMETLSFYPGALIRSYTPHSMIGTAVLLGLLVLILMWRKLPKTSRFVLGFTLFNVALTLTHPNYQERYLLTSVPMIFICAGLALAHSLEHVLRRFSSRWDGVVHILAVALALFILSVFAPERSFLQQNFSFNTQGPEMSAAFGAICDEAVQGQRSTVLGFSGTMAPASIALECYGRYPKMQRSQMPTNMTRHGFHGETSADVIVASQRIDKFFVIDSSQLGRSVGRLQEDAMLPKVIGVLASDTHYEEKLLLDQGAGGFRISVYGLKPVQVDKHL